MSSEFEAWWLTQLTNPIDDSITTRHDKVVAIASWQAGRASMREDAVKLTMDAGYRSTGIPAYAFLADKIKEIP